MRFKDHIPEDRDYEKEDSSSDGDVDAITETHLFKMIEKVMSKNLSREEKMERLHRAAGAPFKLNIREFWSPMNFQVQKMPEFDEKTDDPYQHVLHYETAMTLWQFNNELMCKMFPQSLIGGAITWFNQLLAQSIGTYHELVGSFCSQYKYNKRDRKGCHALFLLGTRKEESIRQFTRRFKQELADVDGANDQVVITAYKQAYQHDQRGVYGSLVKRPPNTLEELYDRAEEYARVEDDSKAQEEVNRSSNHPNDGKKYKSKNRSSGQHNDRGEVREKNQGERMETGYQKYHDMKMTPLNIWLTELYEKISKDIEVQRMIDVGKLREYMKKDFVKGPGNVNGAEIRELGCTNIEFSETYMIGVYAPHNDAIVITAWIGLFRVHQILVDTGSSGSVLFSGAYSSMNLPHDLIEEDGNPIIGFSGEVTKTIGKVKIPITVDDKSVLGNFLVLDCQDPYNAIVGRDWLHEIGAVTSSYHQCLKFIAPEGVVKVRSDHMASHKCHESVTDEYKKSEVSGNQIMRVDHK
ncbi:uncharacterized protein LOC113360518 [Papaver somniferum]|uniref:uncharacterized protein LOC113360518 n=1 Tax=Papaver somniferum TaxID=3469 RepID=UPI000E6F73B8|nr:uncharacterized protein LOC113360518 [Papaver somniferum]